VTFPPLNIWLSGRVVGVVEVRLEVHTVRVVVVVEHIEQQQAFLFQQQGTQ
jgi:hypothetical protein